MLLASIPSPSNGSIDIGPLSLTAYGTIIALGVLAAVWLTQRRWAAMGHDPDDVTRLAMWAVPFGIVGARLYHVITDNQRFRAPEGTWTDAFKVWEGGLGIWGAIGAGALGAWIFLTREGLPRLRFADAVAPGLLVAQAAGRWGNWFNQELFGRPTDVPWALEIDADHRPAGFEQFETFHPTFLYESLWNLALAAVLIWVVPRVLPNLRVGRVLSLYVIGYTVGRLWIELLRIDAANEILGQRLNVWTSIIVGLAAVLTLFLPREQTTVDTLPDDEPDGTGDDDAELAEPTATASD